MVIQTNKYIAIPFGILFILTMISVTYTGDTYSANTTDMNPNGSLNINGTGTNVSLPNAGEQSFNVFTPEGFMVILAIVIGVGMVAGITALGSGLSDNAQRIILSGCLYLGIWAVLSVVNSELLFGAGILFTFVWMILTFMVIIGFGSEVLNSGSDTG